MAMRCLPLLAIAAGLFVTAGCHTKTKVPSDSGYAVPSPGTEVATITGSRRRPGFLSEDHLGYVLLVDSKFVRDASKAWNQPLKIAAGRRIITAEYRNGTFTARADLVLEARPGATYQLKIVNGTEGGEGKRFNDFWIVDARSGGLVTDVHHAEISGNAAPYNPFSVY